MQLHTHRERHHLAKNKPRPTELAPAAKPNYKWFKDALSDRRLSQRELAKRLDMDPGGLNRRLKGKSRLQIADAEKLAIILEVPVADVLRNAGVKDMRDIATEGGRVPIIGWVDSELTVHTGKPKGAGTVEAPPIPIADLKALRFVTAASVADSFDGAVAFYREGTGVPAEAMGRPCVITTGTGLRVLRVLRPGYSRGRYNLARLFDTGVDDDVVVDSAAPILHFSL